MVRMIFVVHTMGQKWTGLEHASAVKVDLKAVKIVTSVGQRIMEVVVEDFAMLHGSAEKSHGRD